MLETYTQTGNGYNVWPWPLNFAGINTYFVGKMLSEKGVFVATDRLGSVRADSNGVAMNYFPWGEERTSTADGRTKFAGYYRDAIGQDYANARYYSATAGNFWSPDPGGPKTADASMPSTWNRYGYATGDPVNLGDPTGLYVALPPNGDNNCGSNWIWDASLDGPCCNPSGFGFLGMVPTQPVTQEAAVARTSLSKRRHSRPTVMQCLRRTLQTTSARIRVVRLRSIRGRISMTSFSRG